MSDQAHRPLTPPGSTPVAAYVRMSTEHQQYSTSNQLDRIKEFAAKRGMNIIRVFADEGKSGLNVKGRESLRKMIAEVESGKADFKCIIAYDVSRWGRFQDADESGYYEYICKRAGILVHYCAEQFENDGSPTSNIIKSVKRSMAGEYSRELSSKVFQGACRLIQMGFKQLAALEQAVQAELKSELAALPAKYGFDNAAAFVAAVRAATGRRRGRPAKTSPVAAGKPRRRATVTDTTRAEVKKLVEAGKTGAEIAKAVGVSLPTVQNIKKALGLVRKKAK